MANFAGAYWFTLENTKGVAEKDRSSQVRAGQVCAALGCESGGRELARPMPYVVLLLLYIRYVIS